MEYLNLRKHFNKKWQRNYQDIIEDFDGKIPKDIGEMLIKESKSKDYTIFTHCDAKNIKLDEFFCNGLTIEGGTDLDYTMSRFGNSILPMLINIKNGYLYKNQDGHNKNPVCLIMKIPNSALNYEPGKTKPILFPTDKMAQQSGGLAVSANEVQHILLPEYILGAVQYEGDKIVRI